MLKRGLIIFLAAVSFSLSFAQSNEKEVEIGVVEHLNDTIPLDLTFLNENNDTVSLAELVTKPTIFNFVYFDCPGLCSPLLSGVSDAVSKLDMKLGDDYQVITISFNTKDTPEKAREKKENFIQKISKENRDAWIYLTGSQENITKATQAFGFKYKPTGVDFAHPSVIIIVSPDGKITRYLYGLSFLPFDVKMALIEAQKGISRPSISKILQVCFAYDPKSRGYTLNVTTVAGAFILGIAAITFIILLIKGRKKVVK
ncbi:SCO family protein [Saccharicrinis sp. FJH2]|uniref:SCO family protein n=1 Tax=Saccharicrinis sp. FJH65 TaxID=3344659 RepID=UPI0035F24B71